MFRLSRRAVLLTPLALAAGSSLAACSDSPPEPAPVDPDRQALAAALDEEMTLQAMAHAWAPVSSAANPSAQVVATLLDVHVATLARTLSVATSSPPPSASAAPTGSGPSEAPPVTTADLAHAAERAAGQHIRASRTVSPAAAQLMASLAASDSALARFLVAGA